MIALVLALVLGAAPLSLPERAAGLQAVERARYAFVTGATKPFDAAYPLSVFQARAARQFAEERLLARRFGMTVTRELLDGEYDRIERETRAPDQWQAIKTALGGDRRMVEEVFCRPLLVDRALRSRFAFDPAIHRAGHERARSERKILLAGRTPAGAGRLRIARRAGAAPTTEELLAEAKSRAAESRTLAPPGTPRSGEGTVPVVPEMAKVLEEELRRPGDVTTILEERDRFSVFRLVRSTPFEWVVDGVVIPKRSFDSWLATELDGKSPGVRR